MGEKKKSRSDKFSWDDGDLKIVYNPNDRNKPVYVMDDGEEWEFIHRLIEEEEEENTKESL